MNKLAIVTMLAGLSGCTSTHYAANVGKFTVEDMVNHIQCEVYEAWYNENNVKLLKSEKWVAAVALTMQEKSQNGISPMIKVGTLGRDELPIYSLGGALAFSQANKQQTSINFAIKINEIDPNVCMPRPEHALLRGRIGVAKVVDGSLLALKTGDFTKSLNLTKEKTFGKSMEFEITRGFSQAGPLLELRHFEGPGGLFAASRTNINTVDISFSKQAGGEKIEAAARRAQDNNASLQIKRIRQESEF